MNIEIVSGSPRNESLSYRVALYLRNFLTEKTDHSTDIIDVRDWDVPVLLQQVITSIDKALEPLKPLAERIFNADAFILVSPEYNGSYTPALKNMFDHFPKQPHKAFGIVTASPGALGGIRASQQMQLLINALFGIASPYMLITPQVDKKFDRQGNLVDESFKNAINLFVKEFVWLLENIVPEYKAAG
jgi:NAD(P)H-dependent FMN reductase